MNASLAPDAPSKRKQQAFSLLEVMIAIGIFFMGVFAILGLVSSSLENARRLQRPIVDAGPVASQLSLTNQLVEDTYSGNLSEFLGKPYQNYQWTYVIEEAQTNKLFKVDIILQDDTRGRAVVSKLTLLLFRPQSPAGSLDGATMGRR
jgi:type II secretory pathway pseudopilin PulG